jgi:hypothetical protein
LVAAVLLAVLPGYVGRNVAEWQPVAFGVAAMAAGSLSGRAASMRSWIRVAAGETRPRVERGPVQARRASTRGDALLASPEGS